jgi:large subunit ribosomal protein L17
MFRNQLTALFTHERITTTLAKAKELRPMAEKMVTLAGTGTLPARRKILTMVPDKDVVRRLFDDIAPRFTDRPGGYTRIMRLGRRHGDGAEMAIIEFVDYELSDHEDGGGPGGKGKGSLMDRAKGIFGGRGEADEAGTEADETVEAAADEVDEPVAEAEAADEPVEEEAAAETAEPEAEATPEAEAADEPEKATDAEAADEPEAEAEPADDADEKKDA